MRKKSEGGPDFLELERRAHEITELLVCLVSEKESLIKKSIQLTRETRIPDEELLALEIAEDSTFERFEPEEKSVMLRARRAKAASERTRTDRRIQFLILRIANLETERSHVEQEIADGFEEERLWLEWKARGGLELPPPNKKPVNVYVKERFAEAKKLKKHATTDEIIHAMSENMGRSYESVKRMLYYKPKKVTKKVT
jgi:hypothetical protein